MTLRALALVVVVLAAPLSAGAHPAATTATVIDRTFSCSTVPDTVKTVRVSAVTGFRDPVNRERWKWQPSAELTSRFDRTVDVNAGSLPNPRAHALIVNMVRCRASTTRVPLSARGLTGGPASQFQGSDAYECVVSGRILMRVRSVFPRVATLRQRRYYGGPTLASTPGAAAQEVQLGVRTLAGKPLAYVSLSETGKATLFTAPGCVSD